ncbi:MAG TPA: purine-nucleoside phosphorylase [Coriobacteriia bacterium]
MSRDERLSTLRHAANDLQELSGGMKPRALVILGSGLSAVADAIEVTGEAPFDALTGFAASGVVGHAGRFVFGTVGETPVFVMMGRLHLYEGHSVDRVVLPVRAAAVLGCEVVIVTNAAGGVRPDLLPGRTMMLTDHINLLGINPLTGPNLDELGVRFPPMADAYSYRLQTIASDLAIELGMDLAEGVYAAVSGPSFETAAEVGYLRAIGADAVGMSTVPEVIAARHAGMQVAGFSLISNVAGSTGESHEQVLAMVEAGAPALAALLTGILARL